MRSIPGAVVDAVWWNIEPTRHLEPAKPGTLNPQAPSRQCPLGPPLKPTGLVLEAAEDDAQCMPRPSCLCELQPRCLYLPVPVPVPPVVFSLSRAIAGPGLVPSSPQCLAARVRNHHPLPWPVACGRCSPGLAFSPLLSWSFARSCPCQLSCFLAPPLPACPSPSCPIRSRPLTSQSRLDFVLILLSTHSVLLLLFQHALQLVLSLPDFHFHFHLLFLHTPFSLSSSIPSNSSLALASLTYLVLFDFLSTRTITFTSNTNLCLLLSLRLLSSTNSGPCWQLGV